MKKKCVVLLLLIAFAMSFMPIGGQAASGAGWTRVGAGGWQYLKEGKAVIGWESIDGQWYYFDAAGNMKTGWHKEGANTWYYLQSSGAMAAGWQRIGSVWNEFASGGRWLRECASNTGWRPFSQGWRFQMNGTWATDWEYIEGAWYCFDAAAYMKTGWVDSGGTWYYLKPNGAMAANAWAQSGDTWYYLKSSGAMAVSEWVQSDGNWYFLKSSGAMASAEWKQQGKQWYYLKPGGVMARSSQDDPQEVSVKGKSYVFGPDGTMRTGWVQFAYGDIVPGPGTAEAEHAILWPGYKLAYRYYFDPVSGAKVNTNGWKEIQGKWYYLKDGHVQNRGLDVDLCGYTDKYFGLDNSGLLIYRILIDGKKEIFSSADGSWLSTQTSAPNSGAYGYGIYKVGTDMPAGDYYITGDCKIYGAYGEPQYIPLSFEGFTYLFDRRDVVLYNGGKLLSLEKSDPPLPQFGAAASGEYCAGSNIDPGKYMLKMKGDCYYYIFDSIRDHTKYEEEPLMANVEYLEGYHSAQDPDVSKEITLKKGNLLVIHDIAITPVSK